MILLSLSQGRVKLSDPKRLLTATHHSTLAFWGFSRSQNSDLALQVDEQMTATLLQKVLPYLIDAGLPLELDQNLTEIRNRAEDERNVMTSARSAGLSVKSGMPLDSESAEFLTFAREQLFRPLLSHQQKAALHLFNTGNAANFSVPGAGKSAVVLSVYEFLRKKQTIRSLFVVGPRSSFAPWQHEYKVTLGRPADVRIVAGGDINERKLHYYPLESQIADLYLTTFQTLTNDVQHVLKLFGHSSNEVLLVIDEAHYIKQEGGIWAEAVHRIAKRAKRCCVLTGTPFPKSYADAVNIFGVLYPRSPILSSDSVSRIRRESESCKHETARKILEPLIYPFYYRVRKSDLHLATPQFLDPISIRMNSIERELYNSINRRIRLLSMDDCDIEFELLQRLRRGRLMRLRQTLSYCGLLSTALDELPDYREDLFGDDAALAEKIARYDVLEIPAKIHVLVEEVGRLRDMGEKVVIWSNFIGSLYLIQRHCNCAGWNAKVICGETPTSASTDEESREEIIEEFKHEGSDLDILIANPAACAESISLHKTCSNAVYYDLSYNCAQYLQSLDRIHRVGGSEKKTSYYRYLQYEGTLEPKILDNLLSKSRRMSKVVDKEFPLCTIDLDDMEVYYDEITK